MALPLWNSKTAHAALLCLHPNDGVSLGICGSGYSSNINNLREWIFFEHQQISLGNEESAHSFIAAQSFFCTPLGSWTSVHPGHGCPFPVDFPHACFSKVSRACPKFLRTILLTHLNPISGKIHSQPGPATCKHNRQSGQSESKQTRLRETLFESQRPLLEKD